MKLKMSEHSLFALLMRKPWWISVVIAVVLMLVAGALLPQGMAVYGVSSGLPFLVVGMIALARQWRVPSAARVAETLQAASAMSWRDFSAALEQAFRNDGYEVARHAGSAADFEIIKAGRVSLVACKRWKAASNGIEPLRELHAAATARDAGESVYVTVGELTDNARRFANDNHIRVIQGAALAQLLHGAIPVKAAAGRR